MKIFRWMIIGCFGLILYASCTKEQLVILDKPLTLDENSAESQTYLRERALDYVNNFQFAQALDVIRLIIDPTVRAEVLALYETNREIAWNEALMLVKDSNSDTAFFRIDKPSGTTLYINCTNGIVPNEPGKLYGLKNYPDITSLTFHNAFLTEFMDLEYLTNLKTMVYNGPYQDVLEARYPGSDYTLHWPMVKFDLSKNSSLTSVSVNRANITAMEASSFPATSNTGYSFNLIRLKTSLLNELHGKSITLQSSILDKTDFIFSNKDITDLSIYTSNLHTINTLETNLTSLTVSSHTALNELIINTGLTKFIVQSNESLTKIVLPENFSESQFSRKANLNLKIRRACQIVNKPTWLDQYITYMD